jgi:hypothetical protein
LAFAGEELSGEIWFSMQFYYRANQGVACGTTKSRALIQSVRNRAF